MEVYVLEAKKV